MKTKYLWIVAFVIGVFISLCMTFNQPVKSDMVEGLNTSTGMPKYVNATATGSLYVHMADATKIFATTSIALMQHFTPVCAAVHPAATSGTSFNPSVNSSVFAITDTSTSTIKFNLNAAASAVLGFPVVQNQTVASDNFAFTSLSVYNTGGATATVCVILGRL